MRLWSLHPGYLDRQGLLALWRETLLAQKVLQGLTRGYRAHPQLLRFRQAPDAGAAMTAYLWGIHAEALRRGYAFDARRIVAAGAGGEEARLPVTEGQLRYEWQHLLEKLRRRAGEIYARHRGVELPEAHPLFDVVPGPVATWERQPEL